LGLSRTLAFCICLPGHRHPGPQSTIERRQRATSSPAAIPLKSQRYPGVMKSSRVMEPAFTLWRALSTLSG